MKYFVVSDIHSFTTYLKESLNKAGYDKTNPNHTLIVLGDIFDRGNETIELYTFLKSIPESNLILIKGNHEQLYFKLLKKSFPEDFDFSNGTVKTFCHIANVPIEKLNKDYYYKNNIAYNYKNKIKKTWKEICEAVSNSEITKFLSSAKWQNYFEYKKYIFVHSFIPYIVMDDKPDHYIKDRKFLPNPNWRNATQEEWNKAMWGCPITEFCMGLFDFEKKNNKVLVCGHWDVSDFHISLDSFKWTKYTPYISEHLIGIDGHTGESTQLNVLVIDEDDTIKTYNNIF